jgi:hypothetical protein
MIRLKQDGGLAGDGITDDSAGLQAIINANPSFIALEGEGLTYKIGTIINLPNNVWFQKIVV